MSTCLRAGVLARVDVVQVVVGRLLSGLPLWGAVAVTAVLASLRSCTMVLYLIGPGLQ